MSNIQCEHLIDYIQKTVEVGEENKRSRFFYYDFHQKKLDERFDMCPQYHDFERSIQAMGIKMKVRSQWIYQGVKYDNVQKELSIYH